MIIEIFQWEVLDQESGQLLGISTKVTGQRSFTLSIILKIKLSAPGGSATQKYLWIAESTLILFRCFP